MVLSRVYLHLHNFWSNYSKVVVMVLVLLAAATAFWLRSQQYLNVIQSVGAVYPEARLDELDPYINYWIVSYLDKNGLLSYPTLTKENQAVCLFWYPECRDLFASDLPGHILTIYFLYQLAKPLGVQLYDLMALIPPLLGALGVVFTALAVRELVKSDLASIASAFVYALMFLSREAAGFTVKYSFGLFTAPLVIWLHARFVEKPSLLRAAIAGVSLAYAYSVWTGGGLSAIPVFVTVALTPMIIDLSRWDNFRRHAMYFGIEIAIPVVASALMRPYMGGRMVLWIAFLVAFTAFVFGGVLQLLFGRKRGVRLYIALIIAVITTAASIVGLMVTSPWFYERITKLMPIAGKILLGLGVNPGGLAATVAEYRPGYTSIEWHMVMILLVTVFIVIPIAFYRVIKFKDVLPLALAVWALLAWYANYNTAYFEDYTRVVASVIAGIAVGYMLSFSKPSIRSVGKIVRIRIGFEKIIAVIIAVAILIPTIYGAYGYSRYYDKYTMIAQAEGFPVPTDVWLQALDFIRKNTSENALVISWWDYGYWLSVIGNRSTVADGATINANKIHRLAQYFTFNYNETYRYLKDFGVCNKDEIYILIFSPVDIYISSTDPTIYVAFPTYPVGFGDVPKFLNAIVYLATGRWGYEGLKYNKTVYQYELYTNEWMIYAFSLIQNGALTFISPNIESPTLLNSTMMRLFMWAVSQKLKEMYPGLRQKAVLTVLGVEQNRIVVFRNPDTLGVTLDLESIDQDLYEVAKVFVSQPYPLYEAGYDAAYRYVFIALLKPKLNILQAICD